MSRTAIIVGFFLLAIFVPLSVFLGLYISALRKLESRFKLPELGKLYDLDTLEGTTQILWSYWHSVTDIPLCVKLAFHTWRKHHPTYHICILNENCLSHYLDRKTLPPNYYKLGHAHKADVIRLSVLEKYGGYWLDASLLLHRPLHEQWNLEQFDVSGYYIDGFTTNVHKKVFENWFIAAPKNSPLISAWKREFFFAIQCPNYADHLLSKGVDVQKIDSIEYLRMHCAYLKILHEVDTYRIHTKMAEEGPFLYLKKHEWSSWKGVVGLFEEVDVEYDMIKLRGCDRIYVGWLLWKLRDGSILSRLL